MINQEITQLEANTFEENVVLPISETFSGQYASKRLADLLLSSAILVLFGWWAMCIAILLSWIELPAHSPLFLQKRVGKNGKIFTCFKIRTMVPNAFANINPAEENDDRITFFGKFLRKSNLDELPQLFNVIAGNMSLVGPRPYMVSEDIEQKKNIPGFNLRKRVLPGITGAAQVQGLHNKVSNPEILRKRLQFDLEYIQKNSFMLDLSILSNTFLRLLGMQNSSEDND